MKVDHSVTINHDKDQSHIQSNFGLDYIVDIAPVNSGNTAKPQSCNQYTAKLKNKCERIRFLGRRGGARGMARKAAKVAVQQPFSSQVRLAIYSIM